MGDGITNVKGGRVFDLIATENTATVQLFRKLFGSPDSAYLAVGQVVGSGQVTDATDPARQQVRLRRQPDRPGGQPRPDRAGPAPSPSTPRPPTSPTLNLLSADDTGSKGDGVTSVKQAPLHRRDRAERARSSSSARDRSSPRRPPTPPTGAYTPPADLRPVRRHLHDPGPRHRRRPATRRLSLTTINLTIDSVPPAVPTFSVLPADDTGLVGDGITSVRRPHLMGTTEPRAKVELLDSAGVVRATTFADSKTGAFSLQPPLDLADGKYTYQARATDLAGQRVDQLAAEPSRSSSPRPSPRPLRSCRPTTAASRATRSPTSTGPAWWAPPARTCRSRCSTPWAGPTARRHRRHGRVHRAVRTCPWPTAPTPSRSSPETPRATAATATSSG